MKNVIVQHTTGDFYTLYLNGGGEAVAVHGPLTLKEAQRWARRPSPFQSDPKDIAWARSQAWQPMAADTQNIFAEIARKNKRRTEVFEYVIGMGVIVLIVCGVIWWHIYATQHPHLSASDVRPGTMVGSDWNHLNTADKWTVIDFWPTTRDTCKARDAVLANNVDAFYAQPVNAQVHIDSALTLVLAQAGCLVDIH